ncbi:MAG: D-aminoacylase [Gammaproteobacteria bacterium]
MRKILILLSFVLVGCSNQEFDLVIINGLVIDGSGQPGIYQDIGIVDDKIVYIGNQLPFKAKKTINAEGLVVSPGFIDPHTHAVRGIYDVPTADSSLLQGITTLTEGNDGTSPFPIAEHYNLIEQTKISPNWAVFVGQGTIREQVMGLENRPATSEELSLMKDLVQEAMVQGALGLSTGLFYVPGNFTPTTEIIELAKVAASYGGIYISHMREEASAIIDSVQETIEIGKKANIPVQITHHKVIGKKNWGLSRETLKLVDDASHEGLKVTLDQYPYTASQTSIRALIPQWAQEGGTLELIARIDNPEINTQLIVEVVDKILNDRGGGHPKNVYISKCSWNTAFEGKSLADILVSRSLDPTPENAALLVFEIVKGGGASAVFHAISEDDVLNIMKHPLAAIGSDGPITIFNEGAPHPRTYGTFARVLGKYVREDKVISLEEAIRKMTSLTATTFNIKQRGLLKRDYFADITIFNPNTVVDNATFANPHQYASGVIYVLVNGQVVVENGKHNGKRPGRILRGPGFN